MSTSSFAAKMQRVAVKAGILEDGEVVRHACAALNALAPPAPGATAETFASGPVNTVAVLLTDRNVYVASRRLLGGIKTVLRKAPLGSIDIELGPRSGNGRVLQVGDVFMTAPAISPSASRVDELVSAYAGRTGVPSAGGW